MVPFGLSSLEKLPVKEDSSGLYVEVADLAKFLKDNQTDSDAKIIKKQNIVREISKYKNGLYEEADGHRIPVSSLFRYLFSHFDDYQVCADLCTDIADHCILKPSRQTIEEKTHLTLYQNLQQIKFTLDKADIKEPDLEYLEETWKEFFTNTEWEKIKIFEWNFQNNCSTKQRVQLETLIEKKYWFYDVCKSAQENAKHVSLMAVRTVKKNMARKTTSEALNGILVSGNLKHRPEVLEKQLTDLIEENVAPCFAKEIVCVDCSLNCQHMKGIHVYIELAASPSISILNDIGVLIKSFIEKHHSEWTQEILFFKLGTFSNHPENIPPRFQTRDKIKEKQLTENLYYTCQEETHEDTLDGSGNCLKDGLCGTCFGVFKPYLNQPLDISTFDVLKEWTMNVPLPVRIFLETAFLDIDVTPDAKRSKTASLYCHFDAILHLMNKNYSGITQDINTDELLVNYHNVTTVFDITSHMGITQSQKTGDRRLKIQADPEMCYYNTFLKSYPLKYKRASDDKEEIHYVNIKQCHLAFLMDNLVHLSFKTDPMPGESRTTQICTLPLTIKGIPDDSFLVQNWHLNYCDGTEDCICKERQKLKKSDLDMSLIDLYPEEERLYQIFKKESDWSICSLWDELKTQHAFDDFQHLAETQDPIAASIDQLNSTLNSVHLENLDDDMNKSIHNLDKSMEALSMRSSDIEDISTSNMVISSTINLTPVTVNDWLDNLDLSGNTTSKKVVEEDKCMEEKDEIVQHLESPDLSVIDTNSDTMSLTGFDYDLNLEDDSENVREIEQMIVAISHIDENRSSNSIHVANQAFDIHETKPILTRHPAPASGRDDDIIILKAVLDDILVKTEHLTNKKRIVFAPDFKIANNLFKLMDANQKYQIFLPEFPVLHLRKSKITNLISAYKEAGLIHILQYMKDEENEKDWSKLLTIENIETATRNVWRLSTALHIALFLSFVKSLASEEQGELLKLMDENCPFQELEEKYRKQLDDYIKKTSSRNATFCLHKEMMHHCDEVIAIAIAERIGGPQGYNLLLASVKSSLPFSFLNGASSYAGFCVRLLLEHYEAGPFHSNLKTNMYTSPHYVGKTNFGLDSIREIDHRTAKKCIRPGSTLASLLPKMSTVDKQTETHSVRKHILKGQNQNEEETENDDSKAAKSSASKYLEKRLSKSDKTHIIRTVKLMERRNAFSSDTDLTPKNIYHSKTPAIPEATLDQKTYNIGKFLIRRYVAQQELLGMTEEDTPDMNNLEGPKELISRVKRGQSVTVSRSKCKPLEKPETLVEKEERKRLMKVKRLSNVLDSFSSNSNTCQAVLKPDGSKNTTNKSPGVKKALKNLIKTCKVATTLDSNATDKYEENQLIFEDFKVVPEHIRNSACISVVEFAGAKFKVFASSGQQYLQFVSNSVIKKLVHSLPRLQRIIICEEKYSFTPDDFKASTRMKRQKKEKVTIAHLKEENEIVSKELFSKQAAISTIPGKKLVSKFLATQMQYLNINCNLIVDVDSEAYMSECKCNQDLCQCKLFATPVRVWYKKEIGFEREELISSIKQCKGEAEMSQADWLFDKSVKESLGDGQCIVNFVTSADIDTLVIHLLSVSMFWPRHEDNTFKYPVYLWLQKKKPEIYDITGIITLVERHFNQKEIGVVIACVLAMGGNDFLPNFHGISHDKLLSTVTKTDEMRKNLIKVTNLDNSEERIVRYMLDTSLYIKLYSILYCPPKIDMSLLTFDEIRQLSVKVPGKDFKHPQTWMPPQSAFNNLAELVQLQLDYFATIGQHDAALPNFTGKNCLQKLENNSIKINLGENVFVPNRSQLLTIVEDELASKIRGTKSVVPKQKPAKRKLLETPQKGKSGKRAPIQSTPK